MLLTEFSSLRCTTVAKFALLLGKLSFASAVVTPGRTFTRRLWDVSKRFHGAPAHYKIVLSAECKKDIQWRFTLIRDWNGKSFFLSLNITPATELGLFTDASGSIGWGAFYGNEQRWIQGRWHADDQLKSIEFKELYALTAACGAWGEQWGRRRIVIHCDNRSVVDCVASGTSKSPSVMSLLRTLFMICARHDFTVSALHVPGVSNCIADALSRFNMQAFRKLAPGARAQPDKVNVSRYSI